LLLVRVPSRSKMMIFLRDVESVSLMAQRFFLSFLHAATCSSWRRLIRQSCGKRSDILSEAFSAYAVRSGSRARSRPRTFRCRFQRSLQKIFPAAELQIFPHNGVDVLLLSLQRCSILSAKKSSSFRSGPEALRRELPRTPSYSCVTVGLCAHRG
jgi:hypothetical protein